MGVRLYAYVGPADILAKYHDCKPGCPVLSASDVLSWWNANPDAEDGVGCCVATYVVDRHGVLRIADRRSEHIACSGGDSAVRAAGEIWFERNSGNGVRVTLVSNYSTGFCPDLPSWVALEDVLARAGLPHPTTFTRGIIFRKCPGCGQRNVVKDGFYFCGVCEAALPEEYNF